jgi:hypothetical protein
LTWFITREDFISKHGIVGKVRTEKTRSEERREGQVSQKNENTFNKSAKFVISGKQNEHSNGFAFWTLEYQLHNYIYII